MARRRFKRKGIPAVKHADTLISTSGSGSTPTKFVLTNTNAGGRQEGVQNTKSSSTTAEECNIGDRVKYVNVHMQGASRDPSDINAIGWLEYAIICKRQNEPDISITELGTLTLGTVATNLYRNDCLWTGFFPIGSAQPNGAELRIKIPDAWSSLKIGFEFVLFTFFRSQNAASGATASIRLVSSYNFKSRS